LPRLTQICFATKTQREIGHGEHREFLATVNNALTLGFYFDGVGAAEISAGRK